MSGFYKFGTAWIAAFVTILALHMPAANAQANAGTDARLAEIERAEMRITQEFINYATRHLMPTACTLATVGGLAATFGSDIPDEVRGLMSVAAVGCTVYCLAYDFDGCGDAVRTLTNLAIRKSATERQRTILSGQFSG